MCWILYNQPNIDICLFPRQKDILSRNLLHKHTQYPKSRTFEKIYVVKMEV